MSGGDKTTPPAAGGGSAPAGGCVAPCPAPTCPPMEIEINDTPATNDDVVELQCTQPAHRHTVPCRIRVKSPAATSTTVVLTNPDGRLRFSGPTDVTKTISVPANGSWASFTIS